MNTKIYKYLCISVVAATLLSCTENQMDIFPDEYKSIVYVKENTANYVTIDATADNPSFDFTVCKGGSDMTKSADVSVIPLTQEYVDEHYNSASIDIRYSVLPDDSYTVDTPLELHFTADETYKVISYTLISEKLAALVSSNTDVRYIIGFSLDSKTTSVNEKCSRYVCEISDVIVPTLGFERAGLNRLSTPIDESYTNDELTIKLPVEVKSLKNRWDINADVVLDKEWLNTYNTVNATDYLLPENYSFTPKVELVSSEQKAYVMITLKNVSKILKAVILPLRLKNASQFKISEIDDICAIMIDPTIAHPVEFDRSTWDWRECCHERWEHDGNCTAYYMIDNDIASYWHYSWEEDSPCNAQNNHCFVFDMGAVHTISAFGYICRQNLKTIWGKDAINALTFFISDNDAVMNQDVHDHSNWKKIVDAYPVETIDEEQMILTRLAMGRYIKVMVAGSAQVEVNNGSMKGCIAEIKAYGKN